MRPSGEDSEFETSLELAHLKTQQSKATPGPATPDENLLSSYKLQFIKYTERL